MPERGVVVVDEAGQIGARQMVELIRVVNARKAGSFFPATPGNMGRSRRRMRCWRWSVTLNYSLLNWKPSAAKTRNLAEIYLKKIKSADIVRQSKRRRLAGSPNLLNSWTAQALCEYVAWTNNRKNLRMNM